MYIPSHFARNDWPYTERLIREHPLGALVTMGPHGLDANHLPFRWEAGPGEYGRLIAHVARANPLWQQCQGGADVLVIFRGHQGYISPNWYPSKHETHRLVPTWNYEVAHVHGRLRVIDDERSVRGIVAKLTRRHEASEPRPWKMGDAPPDYIESMLQAIVGIEIEIHRIEGKAKLSQNRSDRDRQQAADTLLAQGAQGLGQAMRDADRQV
jgi:transcriptional regulator